MKTVTYQFERLISASPRELYKAWLDKKVPGVPWQENDKIILNPK